MWKIIILLLPSLVFSQVSEPNAVNYYFCARTNFFSNFLNHIYINKADPKLFKQSHLYCFKHMKNKKFERPEYDNYQFASNLFPNLTPSKKEFDSLSKRIDEEDLDIDRYFIEEKIEKNKMQCGKAAIKLLTILISGKLKNIADEKSAGFAENLKSILEYRSFNKKSDFDEVLKEQLSLQAIHEDFHTMIYGEIMEHAQACSDITKAPKQFFTQKLCHYFGSLMKNNLNAIKHKTCVKAK